MKASGWWRRLTGQPLVGDDDALARALATIAVRHAQPAMAAALVCRDEVVARATVGVVSAHDPRAVGAASRFHIGSTAKGMTSLLIALLAREGRLRYDSTLGEILPDVSMRAEYAPVTVRDLLLHRAGVMALQDETQEDPDLMRAIWTELPRAEADPARQRVAMARLVLDRPPIAPPRTAHVYSNVGYALLALVAETAAEEPFERLLATRVFGPLGMEGARAGGWPASTAEPDQPRGHRVEAGRPRPQPLDDAYVFPAWMNGAGGIHCPIEDYARYARDTLAGLGGRGALLPAADYGEMHAVQASVRVAEMYAPSLAALRTAYGAALDHATNDIGYGWVTFATRRGRVSAGDGSGGTFFARIVVHPALDLAFVAATSAGSGAAALSEALRTVTGLRAP